MSSVYIYKETQENINNKYVSISVHLQQFSHWYQDGNYSRHQMSASYLHLEECFI